jgi:hypothetical protein
VSWKRTFLLIFALALITGLYFLKVHTPASLDQPFGLSPEVRNTLVLPLKDGEEVVHLELFTYAEEGRVVFKKVGERKWAIVHPVDYPAESLVISGMARLIKMASRDRELALDGMLKETFGLHEPQLSICVKTTLNTEQKCLDIGAPAVTGNGSYAKWRDEDKYFIVGSSFVGVFENSLYTLRKKQVFDILGRNVESVGFRFKERKIRLDKKGKYWELRQPFEAMLGRQTVHELLTELNSIHVKEFLDGEKFNPTELELDPPAGVIRVKFSDGSQEALMLGKPEFKRDAYYAQTSLGNTLLLIAKSKVDKIVDLFESAVGVP